MENMNMNLNNARERALEEMYKAIAVSATCINGFTEMAASAQSIFTMCEACAKLESVGKPDALDKAYERIFAMNKPNAAPKMEGATGNDGSDSCASDVSTGD